MSHLFQGFEMGVEAQGGGDIVFVDQGQGFHRIEGIRQEEGRSIVGQGEIDRVKAAVMEEGSEVDIAVVFSIVLAFSRKVDGAQGGPVIP